MARGAIAKTAFMDRIKNACGDSYIGSPDNKKFYFWSEENGEKIQVYLSITVPSKPLETGSVSEVASATVTEPTPTKMSEDEEAMLSRVMQELDL